MADKQDKKIARQMKNVNDKLDNIDSKMGDIYRNTYSSRNTNKKELERITDDIYDSVNKILSNNSDVNGIPNISRLYTRMKNKSNETSITTNKELIENVMDIFQDTELLNSIAANPDVNRYIKSLDQQYDLICRYMPELKEALNIKKDNVLSSDNFTKEFINPVCVGGGIDEDMFSSRCIEIRRNHSFDILAEEIYDETAMYGEYFLYIVPYEKALNKLLDRQDSSNLNIGLQHESYVLMENSKLNDTLVNGDDLEPGLLEDTNININMQFDRGLLTEAVYNYKKARDLKKKSSKFSMYESFMEAANDKKEYTEDKLKISKKVFSDNLDYGKEFDAVSSDGLTNINDNNTKEKVGEMLGCVVKKLQHENVIPIYIEDVCIGYYYLEFGIIDPPTNNIINSSTYPACNHRENNKYQKQDETILRYLAAKMSNCIDAKFINNNQDLKEEIYVILKYNDKFNIDMNNNIRVTFIPPEDVHHFYFKLDKETHHGISDLKDSLIPAMFHCLLKLTTTIGMVTRGQDKRIYYVKQNIETNVARTLMNVINQIKKGNFGIRQMESMNNILNITGKYNDHVIPVGSNGDSPIQFEVMQGQDIQTPTELLDGWKEQAINSTGVPIEFINTAMQVDYAMRFTMSNSKFIRTVYKRQFIVEKHFSEIFTRIYNYEYDDNECLIEIHLPTPSFLAATNTTQLIANAREYAQQIADLEYKEDGEEKQEFIRLIVRNMLPTYININTVEKLKEKAKINILSTKETENNGEEQ